jgi:F-type H+-transporting ATPase subunit delta
MHNQTINLRYAKALFEFSSEKNQIEETFQDLELIDEVLEENRQLRLLMKSPVVFGDKKLKVINQIFENKISKVTRTFIEILIKKRREEYLHGIAQSYIDIYRESKHIKLATVTSAQPLDDSLRKQLIDILEVQTGFSILLEEIVDPEILGGLIVQIQGVKFDDSIKKKISNLRREFNINEYIREF